MPPVFCRHGRFENRCAICRSEKAGAEPKAKEPAAKGTARRRAAGTASARGAARTPRRRGVVTGSLTRHADDGFRSELVPGLRASAAADDLAREMAAAEARLDALGTPDAGLWLAVSERSDDDALPALAAALVLAIASPDADAGSVATAAAALDALGDGTPDADALAAADEVLVAGPRGPRGSDAEGVVAAVVAKLTARGAGSVTAALRGEASWSAERRFARLFDALSVRGLPRAVRFDLMTALGRSGVVDARAGALALGADQVTDAAKRVFAVSDTVLLERRVTALAEAGALEIDVIEQALWNVAGADATGAGAAARWASARPATTLGLSAAADEARVAELREALG